MSVWVAWKIWVKMHLAPEAAVLYSGLDGVDTSDSSQKQKRDRWFYLLKHIFFIPSYIHNYFRVDLQNLIFNVEDAKKCIYKVYIERDNIGKHYQSYKKNRGYNYIILIIDGMFPYWLDISIALTKNGKMFNLIKFSKIVIIRIVYCYLSGVCTSTIHKELSV